MTLIDLIDNDVVRMRTRMVKRLGDRVDARVLRWYGHMGKMNDVRSVTKVW